MRRAIFIGRFQPPHRGHLEVFKVILAEVDELVVGIGSSQYGHTLENPFTGEERELMLRKAIEGENLDELRIHLVQIPDVHDDRVWVSHVVSLSPPFSIVYSGNPWVERLFREAGYEVKEPPWVKRKEYWGTGIRDRIIKGEPWEELVPKSVLEVMREIRAVERLRDLSRKALSK